LHWIKKPDPEPWLHDHPVSFLSMVLRGEYDELRWQKGITPYGKMSSWLRKRRWFNWIKASPDDRHAIVRCAPHTLTLCFMGPKTREWGYHTSDGWVWFKDYNRKKYRGASDETAQGSVHGGGTDGTSPGRKADSPVVEEAVVEMVRVGG
jgi:hypothetical protein